MSNSVEFTVGIGTAQSNDAPSFRDAADHEFIPDSAASPHLVAPGVLRLLVQCQGGYEPPGP